MRLKLLEKTKDYPDSNASILGLNDSNLLNFALTNDNASDFLYLSIIHLLQTYPTFLARKQFFLCGDFSNLILVFMALAKRCHNYSDHSQMRRCNHLSSLLGGIETFSDDDFKLLLSQTIEMISNAMNKGSNEDEIYMGVVVLDWFIGQNVSKKSCSASAHSLTDEVTVNKIKEGDELWYIVDGNRQDSERVKATILKIHTDDFPNLYFTIQTDKNTKQTISSRLKKHPLHSEQSLHTVKRFDKYVSWIEETIIRKVIRPHFLTGSSVLKEAAAECLNIVTSWCGLSGSVGIGSLRYDVFQLLTQLEKDTHGYFKKDSVSQLSSHLKRISLALGYGIYTSNSKDNAEILRFDCKKLMKSLLDFFDTNEVNSFIKSNEAASLNTSVVMWLVVSVKTTMNESNASLIFALASEIIGIAVAQECYQNYEDWFLMLLRLLQVMHKAIDILPHNLKAVTIDSEQTIMSNLIRIFVKCHDEDKYLHVEEHISNDKHLSVTSSDKPCWFHVFTSFTVSCLQTSPESTLYGAHMQVENLCESLISRNKQWCAFQILSTLSKKNNPFYRKDDNLSPNTITRLDKWIEQVDEEEALEIEEDVLVTGVWFPRNLMISLESFGEMESGTVEQDELIFISNLLKWLLCLDFLNSAASSDMRNRAHISSYINLTGAVNYVLINALYHANLDTRKKSDWFDCVSLDNETYEFSLSDLSTLVLFRTAESIPTLFKSWWNEDCPRSIQPAINKFVEVMVAPETLRRELDRIRAASNLDDLSISGSCVSREVIATYIQDEVSHL